MKLLALRLSNGLTRRSPCGERGLKSAVCRHCAVTSLSLPVRGAWIEIDVALLSGRNSNVAPRAGSVD